MGLDWLGNDPLSRFVFAWTLVDCDNFKILFICSSLVVVTRGVQGPMGLVPFLCCVPALMLEWAVGFTS